MPGPRNMKKKAKHQAKKARQSQPEGSPLLDNEQNATPHTPEAFVCEETIYPADEGQYPVHALYVFDQPLDPSPPPDVYYPPATQLEPYPEHHAMLASYPAQTSPEDLVTDEPIPPSLVSEPFIYDPGNGPRVRNVFAFLASRFAAPPSLDDPLCAEFAQEEMLEMLCSVLPDETALVRRALHGCKTELTRFASDTVV